LANNTWYWTGINQKFIVEAKGQIFQFANNVYHNFSFPTYIPFFKLFKFLSTTIWLKGKNPVSKTGAKASWSSSIEEITLVAFDTDGKRALEMRGRSLQYQKWRQGAIYPKPTKKKSEFLFQLNPFFSKTKSKKVYQAA